MNANDFSQRMPWSERYEKIISAYPSVVRLNWERVFKDDPVTLGRIIGDVLKASQSREGKPGKRPLLEYEDAELRLRQLRNEDYSTLTFDKAFNVLCYGLPIRTIASRVSISKTTVHRLLTGDGKPTDEIMEKIAGAYGKSPAFFLEYRINQILKSHLKYYTENPETSVPAYVKVATNGSN